MANAKVRSDHYLDGEEAFEQRQALELLVAASLQASTPPLLNDLQEVVAPQTPSVRTALEILDPLLGVARRDERFRSQLFRSVFRSGFG